MSLLRMTSSWGRIADSISEYVYAERANQKNYELDKSPIEIYNAWIHKTGIVIEDVNLVVWALSHISILLNMPFPILSESVQKGEKGDLAYASKKNL